jgi:ribosome biogenesis GTPase / thiamine phosphate phosphatase
MLTLTLYDSIPQIMNTLENYGWNAFFNDHHLQNNTDGDFLVGRVISVKGFKYHLITASGELEAELSGKLLFGTEPEWLPRVGDWVHFLNYETQGYITEVFPRLNALSRRNPGNRTERQILAANIDYALIVQGLDRDFNLMRLDRYIVQITACNIKPVVILNKEDLISDREQFSKEVARLSRDCPVYFCSSLDQSGLDELYAKVLQPQKTYILMGSSGVGKSSLLNALMDDLHLRTSALSESTHKGKHTTATRDLFRLPDGSLVIDTPGMREFGIALEDEITSSGLFPAIDDLAGNCRYADCQHLSESGCAVIKAYENGSLDPKIYESYLKLVKEQKHFEIRIEDRKRLGKQFGKMVKEAKEFRKRYKY